MTRGDILVGCGLVSALIFCGWMKVPIAREADAGFIEAMAYSQKSPAHVYAAEYQWQCTRFRDGPGRCAMGAIGSAFSEKGAVFAEEVKAAVADTRDHMKTWLKENPPESGLFTRTSNYAWPVYNY